MSAFWTAAPWASLVMAAMILTPFLTLAIDRRLYGQGTTASRTYKFPGSLAGGNGWRLVGGSDEGQEMLIRHPDLVHPDFNPDGVCIGVIYLGEGFDMAASYAAWFDHQDCYVTREIRGPFEVHPIPGRRAL